MDEKRLQKVMIVILCLVLIRGLIYGLLIPFDRAPDEGHHFRFIKAKQLQLNQASREEIQRAAAQFRLTRHYLLNPESVKKPSLQSFVKSGWLANPPSSLQIYYLFTAWVLKILALENMRDEIYVIRGISILCGTLVVFLSFLVARELFPDNFFLMVGAPLFITFIPQFSATNGVINNDKLAEVFAAFLFWLVVKIFKQGLNVVYFSAYIMTMGLALLSKRTTIFTIPLFLVLLFIYYWKTSLGLRMHLVLAVLLISVAIGGNFLAGLVEDRGSFINNYVLWLSPSKIRYLLSHGFFSIESLKYYAKFFIVIYWSFWGLFGYMTIHLHHFWYILAAFAQSLSLYGLFRFILQIRRKHLSIERWKAKVLYLFLVSIVFVVILLFLRSIVFRPKDPNLTQGRYLFTVIIPISILTVFGVANLFHPRYHRLIGAIGLIGLIILDGVCLLDYLLLNFHYSSLF